MYDPWIHIRLMLYYVCPCHAGIKRALKSIAGSCPNIHCIIVMASPILSHRLYTLLDIQLCLLYDHSMSWILYMYMYCAVCHHCCCSTVVTQDMQVAFSTSWVPLLVEDTPLTLAFAAMAKVREEFRCGVVFYDSSYLVLLSCYLGCRVNNWQTYSWSQLNNASLTPMPKSPVVQVGLRTAGSHKRPCFTGICCVQTGWVVLHE